NQRRSGDRRIAAHSRTHRRGIPGKIDDILNCERPSFELSPRLSSRQPLGRLACQFLGSPVGHCCDSVEVRSCPLHFGDDLFYQLPIPALWNLFEFLSSKKTKTPANRLAATR